MRMRAMLVLVPLIVLTGCGGGEDKEVSDGSQPTTEVSTSVEMSPFEGDPEAQ